MTGAADYVALALNPDGRRTERSQRDRSRSDRRKRAWSSATCRATTASFFAMWRSSPPTKRVCSNTCSSAAADWSFFLATRCCAERYNRELAGEHGAERAASAAEGAGLRSAIPLRPARLPPSALECLSGPRAIGLADHAGLQVLSPAARRARPAWRWPSMEAIRRSSRSRSIRAVRSWWPPRVRCRRSMRRPAILGRRCRPGPASSPWCKRCWRWPCAGQMTEHNVAVGQPLGESLDAVATRPVVDVTTPAQQREEVRMALEAQTSRWSFADTSESGVYRVEIGAPLAREEAFAVNVDTTESDLAQISPEELPRGILRTRPRQCRRLPRCRRSAIGAALHKTLLYCVLGSAVERSLLAWRFGRRDFDERHRCQTGSSDGSASMPPAPARARCGAWKTLGAGLPGSRCWPRCSPLAGVAYVYAREGAVGGPRYQGAAGRHAAGAHRDGGRS